jgi:hypothetical protein
MVFSIKTFDFWEKFSPLYKNYLDLSNILNLDLRYLIQVHPEILVDYGIVLDDYNKHPTHLGRYYFLVTNQQKFLFAKLKYGL